MNRLPGFMFALVATGCGIDKKNLCDELDGSGFAVECDPEEMANQAANSDCCDGDLMIPFTLVVDVAEDAEFSRIAVTCDLNGELKLTDSGRWVTNNLSGPCFAGNLEELDNANMSLDWLQTGTNTDGNTVLSAVLNIEGWQGITPKDVAWGLPSPIEANATINFDRYSGEITASFQNLVTAPMGADGPTHFAEAEVFTDYDQPANYPENNTNQ